jgi:two-component system, chemotaxis family, response regulator PixG
MKILKSEIAIAESLKLIDKSFRGSLIVQSSDLLQWRLYFRLGRLSWVTGGVNSHERLQRHLTICCPQITPEQLKQIQPENKLYREQKILVHLQGQSLIQRSQMTSLMENVATEVLFDIIQHGEISSKPLCCQAIAEEQNDNLSLLLPFLEIDLILAQVKQQWEEWEKAGLASYSPNLYPVIKTENLLKIPIQNNVEQQIIRSLNGQRNLREIAAKNQLSPIKVTQFLLSFTNSEVIAFAKVPLGLSKQNVSPVVEKKQSENLTTKLSGNQILNPTILRTKDISKLDSSQLEKLPLVVCVDDSPLICKAVKDIILEQQYRFLEIQEPIKVIPMLLRNKPDLIFLDLMMPIINGYELCGQLRKTPSLKDVPIIILTGKDGLIDRMRAKLVGSTDFMPKPVDKEFLLKMLEKYIIVEQ